MIWSDCSVCLKRQRNMLFVPCGHVITCADCGLTMETCSMCQGEIISKVKVQELVKLFFFQLDRENGNHFDYSRVT